MFWNSLSTKNIPKYKKLMGLYVIAVIVGPILLSLFDWVKERLALMWRRELTATFLGKYFDGLSYYRLGLAADNMVIDNPDQRLSEDISLFTSRAVRFLCIIGVGVTDVIVFSVVLYKIFPPLLYTLWIYSTIGTLAVGYFGRRLVVLNRRQLEKEADYRYALVRVRESTESIAFYAGEESERGELMARFMSAFRNAIDLLGLKRTVQLLTNSYRYYAQIVPTAVIAPPYFRGDMQLGTISQTFFAFNHVLGSMGLVVSEFSSLAEFSAGIRRLKQITDAMSAAAANATSHDSSEFPREITTVIAEMDALPSLHVAGLSLQTPSRPSRALVRNLDLDVEPGQRVLVIGNSGIGKSSLFRAIAGLWDSGVGTITRPCAEQTLFLPQKPFLTLGTLRKNLLYASDRNDVSDDEIEHALVRVNLAQLSAQMGGLDATGEQLSRRLSLGEQQRLAFARILLAKPRFVIGDECTSALDLENEQRMYSLLSDMRVTCISIGNRPSLLEYHDSVLRLEPDGKWHRETPAEAAHKLRVSLSPST